MISKAHSDAARINGGKSNGPQTPQGKAISSANSLRHGMTAKAILLTNEEPKAYCELAAGYYAKLEPADDVECDLVDEMIISKWLQRRDWSNEAALFDLEMDSQTKKIAAEFPKIDPASRYAMAFRALADESKAIQLFIRYATAHQRSYFKALDALLKLRAKLPPAPAPVAPAESEPEPVENNECETNPANAVRPTPECETNPANTEPPTNNDEPRTPEPAPKGKERRTK